MILSDREIKEYLNAKKILIEPLIDEEAQIQPSSVDLRLGNEFRIFKYSELPFIDPKNPDSAKNITELKVIPNDSYFIIQPKEFVLATTYEYIKIPDDIVGRLEGRSSLGRLGLIIHSTAGYIDPGYEGKITLEISNLGKVPIALYPGMRICQIVFEKLSSPAEKPYGMRKDSKYQGQKSVTESKISEDIEFKKMQANQK